MTGAFFERRGAFCSARNKTRVPLAFGVLMVIAPLLEAYAYERPYHKVEECNFRIKVERRVFYDSKRLCAANPNPDQKVQY